MSTDLQLARRPRTRFGADDLPLQYSNGVSEILVGKAIKQLEIPRSELVLLTKAWNVVRKDPGSHPSSGGDPNKSREYVNAHGSSRKHLFDAVKASLARLDVSGKPA